MFVKFSAVVIVLCAFVSVNCQVSLGKCLYAGARLIMFKSAGDALGNQDLQQDNGVALKWKVV